MRPGLLLVSLLIASALSACAHIPPPPPPPPGETMRSPLAGRPAPSGLNRRQYLDQKSGRYYYFDPVKGAYFWENGQPRL